MITKKNILEDIGEELHSEDVLNIRTQLRRMLSQVEMLLGEDYKVNINDPYSFNDYPLRSLRDTTYMSYGYIHNKYGSITYDIKSIGSTIKSLLSTEFSEDTINLHVSIALSETNKRKKKNKLNKVYFLEPIEKIQQKYNETIDLLNEVYTKRSEILINALKIDIPRLDKNNIDGQGNHYIIGEDRILFISPTTKIDNIDYLFNVTTYRYSDFSMRSSLPGWSISHSNDRIDKSNYKRDKDYLRIIHLTHPELIVAQGN